TPPSVYLRRGPSCYPMTRFSEDPASCKTSLLPRFSRGAAGSQDRGVLLAEWLLVELSGARLRKSPADDYDPLRHPELRNLALFHILHEMGPQLVLARGLFFLEADHCDWSLAPLLIPGPDHGGLEHGFMVHQEVLQQKSGYPFTAALHYVLEPVSYDQVPSLVDRREVPGVEPATRPELRALFGFSVVALRGPGGANDDLAQRPVVAGHFLHVPVHHPDLDEG